MRAHSSLFDNAQVRSLVVCSYRNTLMDSLAHHLSARIEQLQPETFPSLALEVFRYQYRYNGIYRQFVDLLGVDPQRVNRLEEIPFLPISFFKTHLLQAGQWKPEQVFKSSGTTGQVRSQHAVRSVREYQLRSARTYENTYGPLADQAIFALLPGYLERGDSSLVCMADHFIRCSGYAESGFFLNDYKACLAALREARQSGYQVLLLGVSFALLDMAEQFREPLGEEVIIMETGGMKGRRKEMIRAELHARLQTAFGVDKIHSEYGMTELQSQAYAPERGLFQPAPTMRVLARELTDPLSYASPGRTGALNIIDLANLDTLSFIATDDLGRVYADHTFEVLGRMDGSEARGCNLMIA